MTTTPAMPPPARILMIRPSALGDVARSVPVLVSLRAAWPGALIDWLVQDTYAPVIRHHPAPSGVVLFPRGRFGRMPVSPRVAAEAWAWGVPCAAAGTTWPWTCKGLSTGRSPGRPAPRAAPAPHPPASWRGWGTTAATGSTLATRLSSGCSPWPPPRAPCPSRRCLYLGPDDQHWLGEFLPAAHSLTGRPYAVLCRPPWPASAGRWSVSPTWWPAAVLGARGPNHHHPRRAPRAALP